MRVCTNRTIIVTSQMNHHIRSELGGNKSVKTSAEYVYANSNTFSCVCYRNVVVKVARAAVHQSIRMESVIITKQKMMSITYVYDSDLGKYLQSEPLMVFNG